MFACQFSVLANPPPESTDPSLPITYAVALDPWVEPLPSPGPVPYLPPTSAEAADSAQNEQVSSRPQLLVINGEGFTLWNEHFERLELIMQTWEPQGNRLLTVVRGRHYYFSDVNLLPFVKWRVPNAEPIMDVIAKLCIAFLEGRGESALGEVKTRQLEIEAYEENGEKKRKLVGDVADVVIH
jgi:platelet-activating factor acetylhydrolase